MFLFTFSLIVLQNTMTIVGISRQDYVDESVSDAIGLAGGLDFISGEDTVLIKPNVNNDKPAPATVSQEVIGEVAGQVKRRHPERTIVADCSNYNYKTIDAMKKTGIFHAALEADAEVINYDEGPWMRLFDDRAKLWTDGIEVPEFFREVDKVLNVCLCKAHRLAGFSGALTNLIGLISPRDRISHLHRSHEEAVFSRRIVELSILVKSDFTVMDATSVFLDEGPESGTFAHPGIIIASENPVAADLAGLSLLKLMGAPAIQGSVWDEPLIKRALELGLAPGSPSSIELSGDIPEMEQLRDLLDQYPKAA